MSGNQDLGTGNVDREPLGESLQPDLSKLTTPSSLGHDPMSHENESDVSAAPESGINNKLSNTHRLESVRSLCKNRGFVFPSSEIYGGLASAYDWAPLGALTVEKIKATWIQELVRKNHDVVLYNGAITSPIAVWRASGHVKAFNDPLVVDLVTNQRHRADHLIAECLG